MSIDPLELILGGVIGTTFSAVYAGVEDLIAKNNLFKSLFKDIKSKLDTLRPLLDDMTLSNKQLPYANNDELRGLEQVLKAGEELVLKCSDVSRWDLYRKYKYATKFLAWGEVLESQFKMLQAQGIRDGKRTAVGVENIEVGVSQITTSLEEVNQRMKQNFMIRDRTCCGVPELPEFIVGLEAPLEELKTKLLGDDGVSMLVLTASGGCGKTTLATKFCTDLEVKDKFGENIYFVTVTKKYSLNSIVEQLYRHRGSQVPTFQNEANALQELQQFLKEEGKDPLLLVLDDVWSGSEALLRKFNCKMTNVKILVTSRSEFPAFSPPFLVQMLRSDDAMRLFKHSASLGDKSSHILKKLSEKIVERCKGFPLAITVVGRSLHAQPIEIWQDRLNQWSKGSSIFDYETELLLSLESSLDALDKGRAIIKKCFLDLGSFPEGKRIPVNALIDIWSELHDIDEDTSCIAILYELNNRSLANLIDNRIVKLDGEGHYGEHYVTQHDLLRELAIYHSKLESAELRERLFIDICGSSLPKWCRKQNDQALKARLVSISADGESSTLKWPSIHLPETEVLVLNLRETDKYAVPEFVEKLENLKVLVIINEHLRKCELTNAQLLSCLSNLKRIRLEGLSLSSLFKKSIQVKSLRKLSLIGCDTASISTQNFSHAFPNLEEMYIDRTSILEPLFRGLCDLICLKKLTICRPPNIGVPLPDKIGNLVNLEELRLMKVYQTFEFPDSIRNLQKLNTLCLRGCFIEELPECIGEMRSLRKFDLRGCDMLMKLPPSVLDLEQLEEVILDCDSERLWQPPLPSLRDKNRDISIVMVAPELSAVYADVEDLIAKNHLFKSLFKDIKSKLDTLRPLLDDMTLSNKQLPYTNSDELRGLEQVLKAGEELVLKCSDVSRWDLYRKYKYATKLLAWGEDLEGQFRDGKRTAVGVENIEVGVENIEVGVSQIRMKEKYVMQDQIWCRVPELPEVIVGWEAPLENLKTKLLGDDGVTMLVLTAPGGCGKTTLATKFCRDQQVKDEFGEDIYFVTVSKKYSLNSIVEQLYRCKGSQVPTLQNEVIAVQWLQAFLKEEGKKPLLLVLDDVWSGSDSLLSNFDCKMAKTKVLVTSGSEFRAFCPPYHLEMLGFDDAMKLFHHSASLGDKSSHIPPKLSKKIVERCKGFPLAIKVVGRSLCAQPIEMWQNRLNQWSKGSLILDTETDLLFTLQSSLDALDALDKEIKECFLDLGSFPEDKKIPVYALIDIWSELYDTDDTSCIATLYELKNRSLANLIDARKVILDGEGYYGEHYVTQHDLLRELAIYHSNLESADRGERLFIDICGSSLPPKWWGKKKKQDLKARLLSISYDRESSESSAFEWPNMNLPETEALVLNFRDIVGEYSIEGDYSIPEFVKEMENLKVLVITHESSNFGRCLLTNPQLLSCLSNLKRIRLEGFNLSSILKNSIQVTSLRKLSLIKCYFESVSPLDQTEKPTSNSAQSLSSSDRIPPHHPGANRPGCIPEFSLSRTFPNLEEMYLDCTKEFKRLVLGDLIRLKKLTIRAPRVLKYPQSLLDQIGNLVNLEELRLMNLPRDEQHGPIKLQDSIRKLQKLNTLCLCYCYIEELPESIGKLRSLRKFDLRGCDRLKELKPAVLDLEQLEEVILDCCSERLWEPLLPSLRDKNRDISIVIAPPSPWCENKYRGVS